MGIRAIKHLGYAAKLTQAHARRPVGREPDFNIVLAGRAPTRFRDAGIADVFLEEMQMEFSVPKGDFLAGQSVKLIIQ